MKIAINRSFAHRTYGNIGTVDLAGTVNGLTLDGAELPEASVTYLMRFALQSLQDAYAGADDATEAQANWAKKRDALIAGTIGSRTLGEGETEQQRVERMITRAVYKSALGGDSPEWKAFDGLDKGAQADKLDAIFAKNEAKLRPAVDEKLAALKAERDRKASLKVELEL